MRCSWAAPPQPRSSLESGKVCAAKVAGGVGEREFLASDAASWEELKRKKEKAVRCTSLSR